MRFRNPWIDPRILQVRPEAVQAYLLSHGWQYLGPAAMPDMLMFDTPQPRRDKANLLLPLRLDDDGGGVVQLHGDVQAPGNRLLRIPS